MRPRSRSCRVATGTAVALAALLLTPGTATPPAAAASDPDRLSDIVGTIAAGETYLEPPLAGGDAASWVPRLRQAAEAAQVPGGVAIAGWVDVAGSTPDVDAQGDDVVDGYVSAGGSASAIATTAGSSFFLRSRPGAPRILLDRLDEAQTRAFAVEEEAIRRHGTDRGLGERPAGDVGVERVALHEAAELWVNLRLLAPDAPSPGALASQVAADPTFFVDTTSYATYPGFARGVRDDPTRRASSLLVLAAVVGGYLAIRAVGALRGSRRRRAAGQGVADTHVVAPPAEVEEALTRLAEELARVPVRLDDLGYRRAQRCRDAAERYVDRDAERDRVGVLLLCRDGLTWLAGEQPGPRCFFHPGHRVDDGLVTIGTATAPEGVPTAVAVDGLDALDDAQVPCCRRCAAQVADGVRPDALRVAGEAGAAADGARRPYFEVDDSWTRTGYGSLSGEWAQQVLDESWPHARREER